MRGDTCLVAQAHAGLAANARSICAAPGRSKTPLPAEQTSCGTPRRWRLYTDGMTEALRVEQMLDVEGLKQAMLEHGTGSAERILSGILQTLEHCEVRDDVAAVIIKCLGPTMVARTTAA
jgi:hypothetical protein